MSHESFWDFSLRIYRLPHVSATCLSLQNEHGFDVNVLLFACWFGTTHGAMPEGLLADALQFSRQWSTEVVKPLRHARTWMKGALADDASHLASQSGAAELREKIKAVELRSEQLQQQALERLVQNSAEVHTSSQRTMPAHAAAAIAHNLQRVREASTVTLTPALAALLNTLQENSLSR